MQLLSIIIVLDLLLSYVDSVIKQKFDAIRSISLMAIFMIGFKINIIVLYFLTILGYDINSNIRIPPYIVSMQ